MTHLPYQVRFTPVAEDDLLRLADFLVERSQTLEELDRAEDVIRMLRQTIEVQLSTMPWSFRKAAPGNRSTRRELVVPAGSTGYLALYEIESRTCVQVLAVRHQLEQDYH
ncbi:type II toxin-antitoxin system RelE/ParE family toxin [Serpentinimonas maccroryi]|uniref:type II toxin-antitoxin system RelE/ParE family toxin n=1 Tax=Serpentinimonas maccroryi TaxID=1458426 RepID=UPI00203413DB|nr:type II toxin-antitoxin system RelE/ParE family toxin [Serpentinimonas maccroryi]